MSVRTAFGEHQADSVQAKSGMPSPAAVFTRGLSIGGGTQWKFKFTNGYGASVIDDGYGRDAGLFELAVIGPNGRINYDTHLTDDVLGYLTEEEVAETLTAIAGLESEVVRP